MSKLRELSKNQPKVIKIISVEGKITPSTVGNYTVWIEKQPNTRVIVDLEKKG
jgi:hypothetical protein